MPTPQNREPGRRPRNPDTERYTMQGDWAVPNQHPTAPPQRRAPTQEQRRAAARRRREIRRRRRRLAVLGTVGGGQRQPERSNAELGHRRPAAPDR